MKKLFIVIILVSFVLLGCSNPYNSDVVDVDDGQAKAISTFADLPPASASNSGFLYYVIDEDTFYYSNGSTYTAIDMGGTKTVTFDIGSWNMYSIGGVSELFYDLTTYITGSFNILDISVIIYNDAGDIIYSLNYVTNGYQFGNWSISDSTTLRIWRQSGSMFDSTNYNDTVMNRGTVLVTYSQN